jgi:hypothetical protein
VFRITLGALLLWDLASRARFLAALYTDDGVLPRSFVSARLPLSFFSGTVWYQATVFALGAVAAALLILGYRTRIAAAIGWLVIGSIQSRNQLLLQHGDYLLRLLLFWSMFLPLGARFSLDARRRPTVPQNRFFSVAGAALLMQIACVYFFAGLFKLQPVWLDGDAVGNALRMDHYVSSVGLLLRPFTGLQRLFTHLTLVFELVAPLVLFVPMATWLVRATLVPLFILFHASLALVFELGNFQYVAMAGMLPFIPPPVWDRIFGTEHSEGRAALRNSTAAQAAALIVITYVMASNVLSFPRTSQWLAQSAAWQRIDRIGWQVMLKQEWSIFSAPEPGRSWLVAPATLADGSEIDVYRGTAVDLEPPGRTFETYGDFRWRQYIALYILSSRFTRLRPPFAAYLCRRWNESHAASEHAGEVSLYRVDDVEHVIRRVLLLHPHPCP